MFSILSLIRAGEIQLVIIYVLARCFVVFVCMPVHELSHALIAYKLGDNTAKNQGRLTFNPIKHLNPIGTLMIFLFGIGYAEAVPVNPNNFKNPKQGMALTAVAGPISNLLMGFISVFFYCALYNLFPDSSTVGYYVLGFFYYAAVVNVSLAAFNILPVPPLDGSKVLAAVLPDKAYYKYMQYERYIMILLLVLLFTGVFDRPVSYLTNLLMNLISFIPALIFHVG